MGNFHQFIVLCSVTVKDKEKPDIPKDKLINGKIRRFSTGLLNCSIILLKNVTFFDIHL